MLYAGVCIAYCEGIKHIADNLHEIIDTILPKKFEMLEQEYLI